MDFIPQVALENAVLFKLFLAAQETDRYVPGQQIVNAFNFEVSQKRITMAFQTLESTEYCYTGDSGATISERGYKFVESQLAQDGSSIKLYSELGDDWLSMQSIGAEAVPASDRVITRKDNLPAVEEIETQFGSIQSSLAADNEVGNALGDEREMLIGELAAAETLTKSKKFRLSKLLSLILPALKFLSEKFSGAAIGEAAKKLVNLLLGLS
jgi:hypothetical protein